MFIRIEPSSDPQDNTHQKSNLTSSVFQYIRTVLCLGGIYCGEGNATRRWKKKAAVLVFLTYLLHVPLYSMEIYDRFTESKHTTRLIGCLVICTAVIYLSFVSLVDMPKDLTELEQIFNLYMEKYKSTFVSSHRLRLLRIILSFTLLNCVVSGPVLTSFFRDNRAILCDVYPSCHLPGYWKHFGFALNGLFSLTSQIQWQGRLLVCLIFTAFLLHEFKSLAQKFKDLSMSGATNVENELEALVDHHECLVDVLNETNNCMRHYNFVVIFLCIPVNCVFLYGAISNPMTESELIYLFLGITIVLGVVIGKVFFEALVSSKAHEPLRYIWKMRKGIVSDRGRQTLDMFVARLTGETISYDVYGLLTVTMPTLLGILGTVTTYIIVVIQFKPTDAPLCNPTVVRNVTCGGTP
ncbi:uncharacterized protein [Haliotis asinina]|uniref:uncharacterized protein n=1 Tax=Haliotis asinina TaxID=109174 RepID=UPI003531E899